MHAMCALPIAMRTILLTATTTLACVAPELTKGLDGPVPEQSDILPARFGWRKAVAASVLVARLDSALKAHYRLFFIAC